MQFPSGLPRMIVNYSDPSFLAQGVIVMINSRGLFACVLSMLPVLAAPGQEQPRAPQTYKELLYPIARGHRWHYRVTDSVAGKTPDASKKPQVVIVSAENEHTFRLKKRNAKQEEFAEEIVGYSLQVQGGGKVLQEQVLVADDGVYRVSNAGKAITPPLRILKTNARKGVTWECDSQSENAQLKGVFVADEEVVEVPAGKFATVVVRAKDFQVGAQKSQYEWWYAPNVGLVKQRVQSGNHDVTLELEKFEKK